MQRAAILPFAASLAPPYFSTLSHKRHDFREKLVDVNCVFWFSLQLLYEIFLTVRRIQQDFVTNVKSSSFYPLFLSDFNENLIFPTVSKKAQISNFIDILSVGTELFRTDGRKLRS
jgi:hypothetical protein